MTGDSEYGRSANAPGDVVANTISNITGADDATAVDCFRHDSDGEVVAAGASDGTSPTERPAVDVTAVPEAEYLTWPADPLVVPAGDAGWLVCWAADAATVPSWAVRSIAGAATEAARQRPSVPRKDERIAALEAETDQLANFTSIVAHDLRNPLAIAQGTSSWHGTATTRNTTRRSATNTTGRCR